MDMDSGQIARIKKMEDDFNLVSEVIKSLDNSLSDYEAAGLKAHMQALAKGSDCPGSKCNEMTDNQYNAMSKLVVVNACIRQADSRTLRIAEPIIDALAQRYETVRYDLPQMEGIVPLTPALYACRGTGDIPLWAIDAAKAIAAADRIVIAAPFWDMSFPAVLKCFFEQTSLFDITFTDTGKTCTGLCKEPKVLYITTRGMDIPTGDPREQATPYLKALGTLWNLGELTTLAAWNMDYRSPEDLEATISARIQEGLERARTW